MIRTFALQAIAALICAIVIALLLGGNDPRAEQHLAGAEAMVLAAPAAADGLRPDA